MDQKSKSPENKRNKPRKPKKISERYLYNAGLHYLQRFPASIAHFKTVMLRKIRKSCRAHPDQNIDTCLKMLDKVTQQFEEYGLLNDTLYTEGMISSLRKQGRSKKYILQKLRYKGLHYEQINKALNAFDENNNRNDPNYDLSPEQNAALIFARKKRIGAYNTKQNKTDIIKNDNVYQKDMARLARAGFSYDTAKFVMNFKPLTDIEE